MHLVWGQEKPVWTECERCERVWIMVQDLVCVARNTVPGGLGCCPAGLGVGLWAEVGLRAGHGLEVAGEGPGGAM